MTLLLDQKWTKANAAAKLCPNQIRCEIIRCMVLCVEIRIGKLQAYPLFEYVTEFHACFK